MQRAAIEALGLEGTDDGTVATAEQVLAATGPNLTKPIARWLEHQRRVCGRTSFTHAELRTAIQNVAQQSRSHNAATSRRRVTTIHQAKNREFEHVVVLWPYQVTGVDLMARRLLYNALTRAKSSALVLVQDPKRDRLGKAPFA